MFTIHKQETKASCHSLAYYLSLKYPINVHPEKRGFTIMILDLPGCMSQGKTLEEAFINIKKAKHLWIETVYAKDAQSIPLPSKLIEQPSY